MERDFPAPRKEVPLF